VTERNERGQATELADLSREEVLRYSRHLLMPEVGLRGQRQLKSSSVLLIGAGGLGSPLALYLAAAGVGRIGVVDHDVVEVSNLQRQVLHGESREGRPKVESARERMLDINPLIQVDPYDVPFTSANAMDLAPPYDVIVDGTDNFPTRYLVNDVCVLLGKPNVYGSIYRFEGQIGVFDSRRGPCYRCLFPVPPPPGEVPSCAEGGVLGVLPGTIGTLQATEVIKLLLGIGNPLIGRLLLYDALEMDFEELRLRKNPNCVVCSAHPTLDHLIDYEAFCGLPGHGPSRETVSSGWEIEAKELSERLRRGEHLRLIDVREPHEWEIAHIDGAELVPLAMLPEHMHEFDSAEDMVLLCRSGSRSARAVNLLRTAGFRKVRNLRGGINAWSRDVDPTVPPY
jgi:molybdopterin/thiamine biosynthesis adenylyltransferase/rhodanese-related sulfurtransferase